MFVPNETHHNHRYPGYGEYYIHRQYKMYDPLHLRKKKTETQIGIKLLSCESITNKFYIKSIY